MSAAIVSLHHETPMTTSLAIAEGVGCKHENIIKLVRKYVDDLSEWGGVGFEIQPFDTDGGKQWRELAYLNEPQATLLMTFMRNSPVVIEFKKALVRAFFDLRDRVQGESVQQGMPVSMSHLADIAVVADRMFRSWMRSGRAAGLTMPQALRLASHKANEVTGIDILAEAGIDPAEHEPELSITMRFVEEWLDGDLVLQPVCCLLDDLYQGFRCWCELSGERFIPSKRAFSSQLQSLPNIQTGRKSKKAILQASGIFKPMNVVLLDSAPKPNDKTWSEFLTPQIQEFKEFMGRGLQA